MDLTPDEMKAARKAAQEYRIRYSAYWQAYKRGWREAHWFYAFIIAALALLRWKGFV